VADIAPPEMAGSLLSLQTALGFALTIMTVQLTPVVAELIGWQGLFLILAIGPLVGVVSMSGLRQSRLPVPE